ncbi:MAG: putative peptidoglycan glycosyltransferase FtsW [Sumerlaeia bacterium]
MRLLPANSTATLIAIVTAALVSLGVVMVYSASGARAGLEERPSESIVDVETGLSHERVYHHSASYFGKQVSGAIVGFLLLVAIVRMPPEWIERSAPWIMLASLILMVLVVATPLGVTVKGARRWLRLGPIVLQPAEFAKIGLVVFMAHFLTSRRDQIQDFLRGFLPTMAIWCVFAGLVVLQKDLGTIILMGAVMLGMWLMARMRLSHLGLLVAASIPVLIYLIFQHTYRIKRILAVFNPDEYAMTYAYQLNQSLIAIGSGGLFGRGLGDGLQKYHFLSEAHTDFIFAIVCEELGFIGAASVVLLFLALAVLGCRVAFRAPDYFGSLVAGGLTMMLCCAAFINFFVVTGMAPTKGLALPFFTYGRSSMMASLISIGIILNIANYTAISRGGGRGPS